MVGRRVPPEEEREIEMRTLRGRVLRTPIRTRSTTEKIGAPTPTFLTSSDAMWMNAFAG